MTPLMLNQTLEEHHDILCNIFDSFFEIIPNLKHPINSIIFFYSIFSIYENLM